MRALASNSSKAPALSDIYVPQCSASGQWLQMQCDGPREEAFEWYERWKAHNSASQELAATELLTKLMSYREAASRSFRLFLQSLYEAGQQGVFPELARYSSLQDVPLAVLEGNQTQPRGGVFLEPYLFWQMLNGQLHRYPGPYSDFSAPLAHFDLRTCWCVDEAGQELEGTRTEPGKVPACELNHVKNGISAFEGRVSGGRVLSARAERAFRCGQVHPFGVWWRKPNACQLGLLKTDTMGWVA